MHISLPKVAPKQRLCFLRLPKPDCIWSFVLLVPREHRFPLSLLFSIDESCLAFCNVAPDVYLKEIGKSLNVGNEHGAACTGFLNASRPYAFLFWLFRLWCGDLGRFSRLPSRQTSSRGYAATDTRGISPQAAKSAREKEFPNLTLLASLRPCCSGRAWRERTVFPSRSSGPSWPVVVHTNPGGTSFFELHERLSCAPLWTTHRSRADA